MRAGVDRFLLLNVRQLGRHPLRSVTSLVVVAVCSALIVAVFGTYGSLSESTRRLAAATTGGADLQVVGLTPTGMDERLLVEIRGVDGITSSLPLVQARATMAGDDVLIFGTDSSGLTFGGDVVAQAREALAAADVPLTRLATDVVVGPAVGVAAGDTVTVGGERVRVAAVAASDAVNGGHYAFAALPVAQRLTGHVGRIDAVLITADGDLGALRQRLRAVVGDRAAVVDPDYRVRQGDAATALTRTSTLLVALSSLVIAAFLVLNMMNLAVASRRRAIAVVRALGARTGGLARDLVAESALLALVGAAVGVPLGVLAGRWAVGRLPAFAQSLVDARIEYHLPWYAVPVAAAACLVSCAVATAGAARTVSTVPPVEALGQGERAPADDAGAARRWAVVAVGAGLVLASLLFASVTVSFVALAAGVVFVVGFLAVGFGARGPLVAAATQVASWCGAPGRLGAVAAARDPRRTWATLMTVAASVALGVGISGAMGNMVDSTTSSLAGLGDPDLYVSSSAADVIPTTPLAAAAARDVAAVPGVARVSRSMWLYLTLGERRVLLQGVEAGTSSPLAHKLDEPGLRRLLAGEGIVLSKALAEGLGVGDTLRLPTDLGPREVPVLGAVDYVSLEGGVMAASLADIARWYPAAAPTFLQVTVAPGADVDEVASRIRTAAPGTRVYRGAEAVAAARSTVTQMGSLATSIQWIVAVVAAFALANTLLLAVVERRREIGVYRALGASRRFITRAVLAEAVGIALAGAALGLVAGTGLQLLSGRILTTLTHVHVAFSPSPGALAYAAVAIALCVGGALFPARRASRLEVTDALATE